MGFTSRSVQDRWQDHVTSSRLPETSYPKSRSALRCAIRKYGSDLFRVRCLVRVDSLEAARKQEQFYIPRYKTFGSGGYNLTLGGEGVLGLHWTHTSRRRLGESIKTLWDDPSYRQNVVSAHLGQKAWNRGLKGVVRHTNKARTRISATMSAKCVDGIPWLRSMIPWNKGLKTGPLSEEHRRKIRLSELGHPGWNKGMKWTAEQRLKLSKMRKGRPWTEARRAAQRA